MSFLKKLFKPVAKVLGAVFKPIGKLLKKWLSPKVADKEGLKIQRKGSDFFIPVVYGTREVGAIIADENVTDAPGGAENEFFHRLAVFCYGEIDAFEEFFFNGISENDPRWLKDKNNPSGEKWFTKETRTGAVGQTAVNAVGKLNRFSAENSKGEGIAHAFFTFQQDKDQTVWNGEPEITCRIRGKKCFDPRTGVTAYTENGALHLLDYVKSPVYGKTMQDSEIDIASFISVANTSDTNETAIVDTQICQTVDGVYSCSGSPSELVTFKRFSNNTIIDTERTNFDNMQEIADSFRGFFPDSNGLLKIACEKEERSVFSFNSANILSNITSTQPGRNDRYNRVIIRFPNKANQYEMDEVCFPDENDPLYAQWLAEDNGLPQELVITAEYCVYKALALQLAEVAAKVSRNAESVTFTGDMLATECDVGDVIDISEETRGWLNRTFRISDIEYREDGFVNITAVQHSNALYPWSQLEYTEVVGGSNLGDPSNIPAPFNLSIVRDLTFATAGTLTWDVINNAFIRRYEVTVSTVAPNEVVYRTETLGRLWSIPLLAANNYSITVRAVSSIGTVSAAAAISFNLVQPFPPTDINFTLSNFEIEARPVLTGIGLGTEFEFAIGDTNTIRGRGASIVFTGLKHGTQYEVFARTVNALGVSTWFSKTTTTTSESADIIDLIGEDINATIFEPIVEELQNEFNAATEAINQDVANLNDEIGLIETDLANFKTTAFENERELKLRISREEASRIESDKQLFNTTAEAVKLRNITSEIRGAVFDINPENGTITLKAFNYTDSKFSEAAILIDGVNSSVAIQANRITNTEQRITQAESELLIQAGQISLKASFTEVNEAIAGAIDAILPAYSFGFFNSAEGWSAVNGAITAANQKLTLTWGDITNQSLSYPADENPLISISILRTSGSGWTGDLIVTYLGGSTVTYPAVIENIPTGTAFVRNLNLSGESSYVGTVTGLRLVLGASTADEFEINLITVGQPSAALVELEGVAAQVNSLGIEIDAVNASLSSYVTTAFYTANTVTLNNVETVLDGTDAIISLKATQTFINNEGTIEKANSAAIWVDAAEANITNVVTSFNAQPGGINDQLNAINETFTFVQNEIDAAEGLARTQAVSINRINKRNNDQGKEQLQSEYELYLAKRNLLEVGSSIATAEFSIQALAEADQALAQSIIDLSSSTGTQFGQLNASLQQVNTALTTQIEAVAQSVTSLNVSLSNDINAAIERLDQVDIALDGNASAITLLQGTVNNPTTGLLATFSLAQAAKTTADGTASSITLLQNEVEGIDSDLTATTQLAQQTAITAGNNATAISNLSGQVNSPTNGLSATFNLTQQAQISANNANTAATTANQNALAAAGIANSKGKVIIQSATPAAADRLAQNLWIDTTNNANAPKRWSGTAWVAVTDKAATDAAAAAVAAQNTATAALNSATAITNTVNNPTNGLSATNTLAQQAKTTADGAVSSINTLSGQVNNSTTGLSATFSLAQQAQTTANGNSSSITAIQGAINNSTTGLSATYTLAQSAKSTADGNTNSITTINNAINNGTTGLSATFTLATNANSTATTASNKANTNASAIAGLQTSVTNLDQDLGQAELLLQSTVSSLGQVSARAFLGVTTVTAGRAVINGIVVDGATNTLEFRGNTLRWADNAGNLQLYASSQTGKLIYNGDMVAGTFQTATSGFRAEMSGTGMFPFWYGANAKTLENALFAVDNGGNVTARNATLHNVTMSGILLGATGTFSGNLAAAGGTFNGTLDISRNLKRFAINPSSVIPVWFGSVFTAEAQRSRENADFFIDEQGRFKAPITTNIAQFGRTLTINNSATGPWLSYTFSVPTNRGVFMPELAVNINSITHGGVSGNNLLSIEMQLIDQFSQPLFSRVVPILRVRDADQAPSVVPMDRIGGSLLSFGATSHENLNYYTQRQFTVRIRLVMVGMNSASCVIDWKLTGIENNAPVMGPIEWSI